MLFAIVLFPDPVDPIIPRDSHAFTLKFKLLIALIFCTEATMLINRRTLILMSSSHLVINKSSQNKNK